MMKSPFMYIGKVFAGLMSKSSLLKPRLGSNQEFYHFVLKWLIVFISKILHVDD